MERLTTEYIESQIARTQYLRPEGCGTLTICVLTMKNGLHIVGESACLNPNDFDQALGEKYARENAFSKLWQLEGYARANAAQVTAITIAPAITITREDLQAALRNDPERGYRVQVYA